jgi:alpha-L-arabinofuranosidase
MRPLFAPFLLAAIIIFGADVHCAEIVIGHPAGEINPTLFGTNVFASIFPDHEKNLRSSIIRVAPNGVVAINPYMVDVAQDAGLGLIRFPGGELSESYHWRGGVGPQRSRSLMAEPSGRKFAPYIGTLEIAEYADMVGAELILTVNYTRGSAQEAANWVEFCNGPAPEGDPSWTTTSFGGSDKAPDGYFAWLRKQFGREKPLRVRFWEIGNEIYFTKDSEYLSKAREFARAMRKADSAISIGVCADPLVFEMEEGLRRRKMDVDPRLSDMLVLHYYGSPLEVPPVTRFFHNGTSKRTFFALRDETVRLLIWARGDQAMGAPVMRVQVNGQTRDVLVGSEKLTDYFVEVKTVTGKNDLAISFVNDARYPGIGDRNLYVERVRVIFSDGQSEEVWSTRAVEHAQLFANAYHIGRQLCVLREAYPGMKLALTEVNTGYGLSDMQQSHESAKLKAALWFALVMNGAMRNGVEVLNQFTLASSRWGFGLVNGDGSVNPTYLTMKMYAAHQGRQLLDVTIKGVPTFDAPLAGTTALMREFEKAPLLDAIASFDQDTRQVLLTLVNVSESEPVQVSVDFSALGTQARIIGASAIVPKKDEGLESSNRVKRDNLAIVDVSLDSRKLQILSIKPYSCTNVIVALDD